VDAVIKSFVCTIGFLGIFQEFGDQVGQLAVEVLPLEACGGNSEHWFCHQWRSRFCERAVCRAACQRSRAGARD